MVSPASGVATMVALATKLAPPVPFASWTALVETATFPVSSPLSFRRHPLSAVPLPASSSQPQSRRGSKQAARSRHFELIEAIPHDRLMNRRPLDPSGGEPGKTGGTQGRKLMSFITKFDACTLLGLAALGLVAFSASARAEVLFDSLASPTTGSVALPFGSLDATFDTGSSAIRATDITLLLEGAFAIPSDTFTVSLEGGVPLSDVSFDIGLGLSVEPNQGPILGSATLPISNVSDTPTAVKFTQFGAITLQPNSLYWIDLTLSGTSNRENGPNFGWDTTDDDSGVGVANGYNASDPTDFLFFPNNKETGGQAFQMEVSGVAAPEPSTWAMMALGFTGLGFLGWSGSRQTAARAI
jgi:hypothetical protein